jgi:uncharacterized membrane protein YdjX (TVP38/TMEM64 family)
VAQKRRFKAFRIVIIILVIGIAFLFFPIKQWISPLQDQIRSLGVMAPIVVIAGYVLFTVLLIPGSVLTIIAGGIFGLWEGLMVAVAGANLGALCSFLLARTFLRQRVAEWAAENPKFASLDRAVGREGFKMILLSRLSPAFPFTLLNYLLGLTMVKTRIYVLANLIGMLPGTFLYVYLGVTAQKAMRGGTSEASTSTHSGGWLPTILGLVATIAVILMITRMARRAMAEVDKGVS